jgi:hypothetical protein
MTRIPERDPPSLSIFSPRRDLGSLQFFFLTKEERELLKQIHSTHL